MSLVQDSHPLYGEHLKRIRLVDVWFKCFGLSFRNFSDHPFSGTVANRQIISLVYGATLIVLGVVNQIFSALNVRSNYVVFAMFTLNSPICACICIIMTMTHHTALTHIEREIFSVLREFPNYKYEFKSLTVVYGIVVFCTTCWLLRDPACFFDDFSTIYSETSALKCFCYVVESITAKCSTVILVKSALHLMHLQELLSNMNGLLRSLETSENVEGQLMKFRFAHTELLRLSKGTFEVLGFPILISFSSNCIVAVIFVYNAVLRLVDITSIDTPEFVCMSLSWFTVLTAIMAMLLLTDSSTRLENESRATRLIIQKICFSSESEAIHVQCHYLSTQLLLHDIDLTVCGCFRLNNSFFFEVLGTLLAYIIVMVQMKT